MARIFRPVLPETMLRVARATCLNTGQVMVVVVGREVCVCVGGGGTKVAPGGEEVWGGGRWGGGGVEPCGVLSRA